MEQSTSPSRSDSPFAIDPDDQLPVGTQLAWKLRALISTGRLDAGDRLPSFRQLADWAGVNVNTVRSVYARLERDGLVESVQGSGTFVAAGTEASPALEEIAIDALRRAERAGISPRELAIVATACADIPGLGADPVTPEDLQTLPDTDTSAESIEVRHELHRQIARLEAELAAYMRDLPDGMPTAHPRDVGRVQGIGELERTRDTLIAKLSEAQKAATARARVEGRERAVRERALHDATEADTAAEGPLARAMSWWRDRS